MGNESEPGRQGTGDRTRATVIRLTALTMVSYSFTTRMEWISGLRYRPLINHGVRRKRLAGDLKKWRKYFPDGGSVIDIGPGCSTGVIAGTNTKFPTHYRDALFICDWTFATMYSIHLKPNGRPIWRKARSSPTPGIVGLDRCRRWSRW